MLDPPLISLNSIEFDSPVSQRAPLNPKAHVQLKPLTWSLHVAAFWHGFERHSSISENTKYSLEN